MCTYIYKLCTRIHSYIFENMSWNELFTLLWKRSVLKVKHIIRALELWELSSYEQKNTQWQTCEGLIYECTHYNRCSNSCCTNFPVFTRLSISCIVARCFWSNLSIVYCVRWAWSLMLSTSKCSLYHWLQPICYHCLLYVHAIHSLGKHK